MERCEGVQRGAQPGLPNEGLQANRACHNQPNLALVTNCDRTEPRQEGIDFLPTFTRDHVVAASEKSVDENRHLVKKHSDRLILFRENPKEFVSLCSPVGGGESAAKNDAQVVDLDSVYRVLQNVLEDGAEPLPCRLVFAGGQAQFHDCVGRRFSLLKINVEGNEPPLATPGDLFHQAGLAYPSRSCKE